MLTGHDVWYRGRVLDTEVGAEAKVISSLSNIALLHPCFIFALCTSHLASRAYMSIYQVSLLSVLRIASGLCSILGSALLFYLLGPPVLSARAVGYHSVPSWELPLVVVCSSGGPAGGPHCVRNSLRSLFGCSAGPAGGPRCRSELAALVVGSSGGPPGVLRPPPGRRLRFRSGKMIVYARARA